MLCQTARLGEPSFIDGHEVHIVPRALGSLRAGHAQGNGDCLTADMRLQRVVRRAIDAG